MKDTDAEIESETVKPDQGNLLVHGAEGAASGAVAGAVLGAAAGPPGIVAGAVIGTVAGAIAAVALDREAELQAERTRELDAELGVTKGAIGAPQISQLRQEQRRAPSPASLGLAADGGEGAPAEGPMQAPEE